MKYIKIIQKKKTIHSHCSQIHDVHSLLKTNMFTQYFIILQRLFRCLKHWLMMHLTQHIVSPLFFHLSRQNVTPIWLGRLEATFGRGLIVVRLWWLLNCKNVRFPFSDRGNNPFMIRDYYLFSLYSFVFLLQETFLFIAVRLLYFKCNSTR